MTAMSIGRRLSAGVTLVTAFYTGDTHCANGKVTITAVTTPSEKKTDTPTHRGACFDDAVARSSETRDSDDIRTIAYDLTKCFHSPVATIAHLPVY